MNSIADAVRVVRERIEVAARRAGRDPGAVTLVAATKGVSVEHIAEALEAGIADIGENRAQELVAKAPALAGAGPTWHFLGALQRNKVRSLASWVSWWHTVDRAALGVEIARRAPGARVLVEVNLGLEPQKSGASPSDVPRLVDELSGAGLDVRGLMAIPPRHDEPRRWFAALAALAEPCGLAELSMGMTEDFEVAVEEGATLVRVGRAIFGER
jgi:PLP dependent protein